jgi:hypothetical protein
MTTDGYVENAAKNALLRRTDTTKFVTMQDLNSDDSKAQPEDFATSTLMQELLRW